MMVAHLSYPREHRPFEKKPEIPTLFNKAKRDYFDGIQNFANQLISFIKKEEQAKRLAIYNLKAALAALPNVQKFFDDISLDGEHQRKHVELCSLEEKVIFETYMCCEYYLSHSPDTNYNKYQVKAWFSSSRQAEIDEVNSTMTDLTSRPLREFCVSVFRQNQEYHVINVHDGAYSPWLQLSRKVGAVCAPRAA